MTLYVTCIRETIPTNNGTSPYPNKCWNKPLNDLSTKSYGLLSTMEMWSAPWETVTRVNNRNVDLFKCVQRLMILQTLTIIMLPYATCHCKINNFRPFEMGPWTICFSMSLDQNVSDLLFTFQWIKALAPPMDQAQRVHKWFSYTIISNPDTISMCLRTLPVQKLQGQDKSI